VVAKRKFLSLFGSLGHYEYNAGPLTMMSDDRLCREVPTMETAKLGQIG